ncbi:glycoside hydrolase family 99-like domain-containing protein [Hymenobacter defluvii]|uniref:Glycoside hydrolase family 99-like domain-containing protein n=1 Tax=Hymenobacter defluvii TaxID=2054411 RepID=A0ABS3THX5_9BACT|nr:glycoside hydrolase family 99-like domain-containing protein [Hymenobacter defluvii]MBO3273251.1 glycoside hydrolase family 99-like domain-containing protein [Hymenobacter defluvii]
MSSLRALAIYLPQFHPISENDEWWGTGFTEWTNVTKALPRFPGHYQPQLPADLGFYDLRLPQARQAQAELAKAYGIHGFCYYHYWFNGRRVLDQPFEEVLSSGSPDFPFCLCWANENWTRRWDGQDEELLLKQDYSEADDVAHIQYLATAFADPRYIRVDGKPVFIIYRADLFPDISRTLTTWRVEAKRLGVGELYLIKIERFVQDKTADLQGFDATMQFEPDGSSIPKKYEVGLFRKIMNKLEITKAPFLNDDVFSYKEHVRNAMQQPIPTYKRYPCIMPSWDNSARRKKGAFIMHGSTPSIYERWLAHIVKTFKPFSKEENFIFINAWNEWAEGNHLEPCQRWNRQYLEATKRVLVTSNPTE